LLHVSEPTYSYPTYKRGRTPTQYVFAAGPKTSPATISRPVASVGEKASHVLMWSVL